MSDILKPLQNPPIWSSRRTAVTGGQETLKNLNFRFRWNDGKESCKGHTLLWDQMRPLLSVSINERMRTESMEERRWQTSNAVNAGLKKRARASRKNVRNVVKRRLLRRNSGQFVGNPIERKGACSAETGKTLRAQPGSSTSLSIRAS
jgi:hypothetical protein